MKSVNNVVQKYNHMCNFNLSNLFESQKLYTVICNTEALQITYVSKRDEKSIDLRQWSLSFSFPFSVNDLLITP